MNGLQQTINAAIKRAPSDSDYSDDDFDDFDDDDEKVVLRLQPGIQTIKHVSSSCGDLTVGDVEEVDDPQYDLYISVAPYEKVEETEISFDENEVVEVIEKTEDGWWLIRIGNDEGWAPESYLVKLEEDDFSAITAGSGASISASFTSVQDEPSATVNAAPQRIVPVSPPSTPNLPQSSFIKPVLNFPVKSQNVPELNTSERQTVAKPSVEAEPKSSKPGPVGEHKPVSKPTIEPKPKSSKRGLTTEPKSLSKPSVESKSSKHTELKPWSKPVVEPKSDKHTEPKLLKPSVDPKPKSKKPAPTTEHKPVSRTSVQTNSAKPTPKLPSKPETGKPQVFPPRQSISKSKVSSISSMFDLGKADERPLSLKQNDAAKFSETRHKFGQPVAAAKASPSKSPIGNSISSRPSPVSLKSVQPKPKAKPTQISSKPRSVVQSKPKSGNGKDSGAGEDELSTVLSRRKVKVDSSSGQASSRQPGQQNSDMSEGQRSAGVKDLQKLYNMQRPR
jgi:hypothetical protein